MSITFAISLACAAAMCADGPPASPSDAPTPSASSPEVTTEVPETLAQPEVPATPEALATPEVPVMAETPDASDAGATAGETGPTAPTLVEFNGKRQFLKTSSRLRVWRPEVAYKMTVDSEGHAVDCKLENKFRRAYINMKLCEVLMQHHTFKPALDEDNAPVEGVYRSRLIYMDMRNAE